MSDFIKQQLKNLYADEIEEVLKTIKNEELWLLGSTEEEEISNHTSNIEELKKYLNVLGDLLDENV